MTDHARNEWAAEALMDGDEQAAWDQSRNVDLGLEPGWISDAEQRAWWASDRAAVEAQSHRDHLREVAEKAAARNGWRELDDAS